MRALHRYRHLILALWAALFALVMYLYFFHYGIFELYLRNAFQHSFVLGTLFFLFLCSFRGFVFLPATMLIILGFLFYDHNTLFVLIMIGVFISSSLTYWFARTLEIGQELETHNRRQSRIIRRWLEKYEMPVVIGWSFAPPLPTDVICYICGALRINYAKFIVSVLIGEALCCALYIYYGSALVRLLI